MGQSWVYSVRVTCLGVKTRHFLAHSRWLNCCFGAIAGMGRSGRLCQTCERARLSRDTRMQHAQACGRVIGTVFLESELYRLIELA
jgi:hypothetical protein